MDDSLPSGNGVAARALLRLGHLLAETRYIDAAERTLRAALPVMQQNPASCATLQRALREFLRPRTHVVIRADANAEGEWRSAISPNNSRATDVYVVPPDAIGLPPAMEAQKYTPGGVAYICVGTSCLPPVMTSESLRTSMP